MITKDKHQVDMLNVVAILDYETEVQRSLLISLNHVPTFYVTLVLNLVIRTHSIVWFFMTPYFIPT